MSRTLTEGTDFDPMGPELYRDPMIRIVAYGGIPIYTAVGYGDDLGYGVPAAEVCGPGKGLKTFDRLYAEQMEPNLATRANAARLAKGYESGNSPTSSNYKLIRNHIRRKNWERTATLPKERRATARYKLERSTFRRDRLVNDPTYGTHIYFRAPMNWPHMERADGRIVLKPSLVGADLQEFHRSASYGTLLTGADPMAIADVGVILYVDPNATMVYNSEARVREGYTAEEIYGAGMTMSEYLIRIRDCGVGYVAMERESYATPADGFLSSDVFGGCISKVRREDAFEITQKYSGSTRKVGMYQDHSMRTPAMLRLFIQATKQFNKYDDFLITFGNWYNEVFRKLFNGIDDLKNMPPFGEKYKPILPFLASLRKTAANLDPIVREIKAKIYPYAFMTLGVLTDPIIDEIRSHTIDVYKLNKLEYGLRYASQSEFHRVLKRDMEVLETKGIHSLLGSKDPEESMRGKQLFIESTEIGGYILSLLNLKNRVGSLFAFLETLPPAPVWAPPPSARGNMTPPPEVVAAPPIKKAATRKAVPASSAAATRKSSSYSTYSISSSSEKVSAAAGGGAAALSEGTRSSLSAELATLVEKRQTRATIARIAEIKAKLGM